MEECVGLAFPRRPVAPSPRPPFGTAAARSLCSPLLASSSGDLPPPPTSHLHVSPTRLIPLSPSQPPPSPSHLHHHHRDHPTHSEHSPTTPDPALTAHHTRSQ